MKNTITMLCVAIFTQLSLAQNAPAIKLSPSEIEHTRTKVLAEGKYNIPKYQLEKILTFILSSEASGHEKNPDWSRHFRNGNYSFSIRISAYDNLNTKAKLTYNLINYEQYFQNCGSGMLKSYETKGRLTARLAGPLEFFQWSGRQYDYFREHRDSIVAYMQEIYQDQGFIGQNLKEAIVEADAWEMIPSLAKEYEKRKDLRLLTTLSLLMKKGEFKPFEKSYIYQELYGEGKRWTASMEIDTFSQVPENIIEFAKAYYKTKTL